MAIWIFQLLRKMIFRLACKIQDLACASKSELEDVFSNLIDADRSGKHFFICRRELCEWATLNLALSRRDYSHLISIREEYAVRGGLVDVAHAYVDVTIGINAIAFDGDRVFSVGHQVLVDGEFLSRSASFVMEDIDTDHKLYSHIFQETRKISNVPSYNFDPIHGGGSRTDRVFDIEIQKSRVVVCVADNDRLAPMQKVSDTAKRVMEVYVKRNGKGENGAQCFIGIGAITVGRELENYIPYHLLKIIGRFRTYRHFGKLDDIVDDYERMEWDDCFWRYFDIKGGICGTTLIGMMNKGKVSKDAIDWICNKLHDKNGDSIEGSNIDGFGENVVDAFFSSPDALKGFHKFVRSDYWRVVFGKYFETLLWYFAAPKFVRV